MLGFTPIAAAPIASTAVIANTVVSLASQAVQLTLTSVAPSASAERELDSQTLLSSLNSVTVSVGTGTTVVLDSQQLFLTQNGVSVDGSAGVGVIGQSLVSTIHSVDISTSVRIAAPSYHLYTLVGSVQIGTGTECLISGLTLTSSIHGARLWGSIDTTQPINCSGKEPSWAEMVLGTITNADNASIASVVIGDIPRRAPPVRGTPETDWGTISIHTNTAWTEIET